MTPEQQEVVDLRATGMTMPQIAGRLGITPKAASRRWEKAKKWLNQDPAIKRAMGAVGTGLTPGVVWDKTAPGYSVMLRPDKVDSPDLATVLIDGLNDYTSPVFAPRVSTGAVGDHLLVVDLADVHFGKLCEASETGAKYNIEYARHRAVEGTKALLEASSGIGIARVLFVMGNDILHTDNGKTTTSGTPQDTDGTFFTAFKAAQYASIDAIKECRLVAETDLLHCMSNHDWRSGWGLSQTIAAFFRGADGVRATDYNMSEVHRKYYGFERNAIMLTHGDGTKEEKIIGYFMQEAKSLVSSCDHFYALLHHYHHKIAKRRGVDLFQSEKDHNGMTAIISGSPRIEKNGIGIEYVRSPSAPDGWHHRNGYMNRQGVECFAYHAHDGQRVRFTEWF